MVAFPTRTEERKYRVFWVHVNKFGEFIYPPYISGNSEYWMTHAEALHFRDAHLPCRPEVHYFVSDQGDPVCQ